MDTLNVAVIIKLEPDFSEGNVSYNPDGTLNRAETKNILGPHSAIAANAAFYAKVKYGAKVSISTMGPPIADIALKEAQIISDADELHLYSDRVFAGADTLATAEVLKTGIEKMQGKMDIVFSGHRASDGETGQTGPQTAWKLGFTFLGNVVDYEIDLERRVVRAQRLITLQGFYNILEEIEAPLPVFITIDPAYKAVFKTISHRLALDRYQKEAQTRSLNYKQYLKVFSAEQLGVDRKLVGLPGSPTIVYKVERIPKGKATRIAEIVDGSNRDQISKAVTKNVQNTFIHGDKMTDEKYHNLYVVIEQEEGKLIPVSLEMLGEARRIMDDFNSKYSSNEKVVAVVLGHNIQELCDKLIQYGADAVVCADNPELRYVRNKIYTKVISQIATDKDVAQKILTNAKKFTKPRYMFFAADSIGRHLSSTVMAELESGLASDINKLVIEDVKITHQNKTAGKQVTYKKTLEMYRPDFSGFLWTTILCLDNKNPEIERDYHPQACSIIPGVFEPLKIDDKRKGIIIPYQPKLDEIDLAIRILDRKIIKSAVDFDSHKAIVSFGRGVKDSPEENIMLIEGLAKELDAEIGISLPISKKPYPVSDKISSTYMIPDRVIGTSGRKVSPHLYIAVGISGAMQHIAGMKESEFVVAINPDENSPIRNECDILIKGRIEDVMPLLIDELQKQRPSMMVQ